MSGDRRIHRLRRQLLDWGDENMRDYPWRGTRDPYAILVAEFMLHRTRADQAAAVYSPFMKAYPTLGAYADGDPEAIREMLYSLGLGWRIDGMMRALRLIHERYGEVPVGEEALMGVPGIGPYIAAAVRCFALNRRLALVDTNTVRVTGRVFGLDIRGEARRRRSVIAQIAEACDPERPRDYYFSMIDLAHMICTPRNPACGKCPVRTAPCEFARKRVGESDGNNH